MAGAHPAHRLLERREPAHRARRWRASGRWPSACPSARAGRRSSVSCWWRACCSSLAGAVARAVPVGRSRRGRCSACCRRPTRMLLLHRRARSAGPALQHRRECRDRRHLRPAPGAAGDEARSLDCAEGVIGRRRPERAAPRGCARRWSIAQVARLLPAARRRGPLRADARQSQGRSTRGLHDIGPRGRLPAGPRQERLHRAAAAPVVRRLQAEVEAQPGVTARRLYLDAAAARLGAQLEHAGRGTRPARRRGHGGVEQHRLAGLLAAMGVPLVEGREFDERDRVRADRSREAADRRHRQPQLREAVLRRREAQSAGVSVSVTQAASSASNRRRRRGRTASRARGPASSRRRSSRSCRRTFRWRRRSTSGRSVEPAALFPALRRVVAQLDPALPIYEHEDAGAATRRHAQRGTSHRVAGDGLCRARDADGGARSLRSHGVLGRAADEGDRTAHRAGRRSGRGLWLVMREVLSLLGMGILVGIPCAVLLSRASPRSCSVSRHRRVDGGRRRRDAGVRGLRHRPAAGAPGADNQSDGRAAPRVIGRAPSPVVFQNKRWQRSVGTKTPQAWSIVVRRSSCQREPASP